MPPNKQKIAAFHRDLQRWYDENGRKSLPWRNCSDPYPIYISEIMLQQTQVKTVLERFYHPFLARFPSLSALAQAKREEVIKAWQGLGYYNRAANLHKAAIQCEGQLPKTLEGLMALPGIGRNTAHAIYALAYRQPAAVMEANVKRVLCRIFALTCPSEAELWHNAALLLNTKNPFDYNQAMMDLGALICTPRAPRCKACPAQPLCQGQATPELFPQKKKQKPLPVRTRRIYICINRLGQVYATARGSAFLRGLYHFIEVQDDAPHITLEGRRHSTRGARSLGHVRQLYSHFALEAEIFLLPLDAETSEHWHAPESLALLPFSAAEQKMIALFMQAVKIPARHKKNTIKKNRANNLLAPE